LLHRIWQQKGKYPTDVLKRPPGELAFLFASELIEIEAEINNQPPKK
jgi:hypothetical protein